MEHVDVLIIGAGISGIGAACHLRMKHPGRRFVILEGRPGLGGTWDLFRYPGVRSDSDMYTFGYGFKPWIEDQDIATGDAILRYLEEAVDEHDVRGSIRFGHRVQKVAWCSERRRWTATARREEDGAIVEVSAPFLITCTGYYDYERGYLPAFEGYDDYRGVIAHPQHWPQDLDYAGKRVLIIGSGATAVTLVPAMAQTAAHVTMLQRSPTYLVSRPAIDPIGKKLRELVPVEVAHAITRVKNVGLGLLLYQLARRAPHKTRERLRDIAVSKLGPDFDVDRHFTPEYEPWDQRLCLTPDGDLYDTLRSGAASIVTDTIERFTETGVLLTSGETLEADIIVPATGLKLQFLGGMTMEVDGEPVDVPNLVTYRGMMFGGIPNWVAMFGYTSASWTLKVDLAAKYVCRLLALMDAEGYETVTPAIDDGATPTLPLMANLKSGYVVRAARDMPKQGTRFPWVNADNFLVDLVRSKLSRIDDGVLHFERRREGRASVESHRPEASAHAAAG